MMRETETQGRIVPSLSSRSGMTIVEVMIVVTIIGVLATLGVPAYNKQVATAKRSDGKSMLMTVQSKMERYIFDNNTYPTSLAMMIAYSATVIPSVAGYYEINLVSASSDCPIDSCYVLRGVPIGGHISDGELLLKSNGTRTGAW